jgi:DNA-binding LytR/AlgR family response regulator
MIKVVIVEDEELAVQRLTNLLKSISGDYEIVATADSIRSAVATISAHPQAQLIFMDIQLADGYSFEIFNKTEVSAPVIFITAYDEYAIKAFKFNSIDYLLKPIKKGELEAALNKFNKQYQSGIQSNVAELISSLTMQLNPVSQKRILVKVGQVIKAIDIDDVAYFYTEDRVVFMYTKQQQRLPVDYNLDELERMLNKEKFFRVNRQIITSVGAIDKMYTYTKSRIKLLLNPPLAMEAIISSERTPEFKEWLQGKV